MNKYSRPSRKLKICVESVFDLSKNADCSPFVKMSFKIVSAFCSSFKKLTIAISVFLFLVNC